MKSRAQKSIFVIVLLFALAIGGFLLFTRNSNSEVASNTNISSNEEVEVSENDQSIPKSLKLEVPFTPQAPTANWDELHNEACEEASIIMAQAYFNNISSLPAATVEKEITKLTKWQQENYGYHLSVNTSETERMAKKVYDLKTEVVDVSEQNIKQALANGELVIFPVQGQMLGNPYFTGDGPIYHMLVITGFDEDIFITNDPGTRRGEDYIYTYEILEAAAGNWSHEEHKINLSDKKMIIVSK